MRVVCVVPEYPPDLPPHGASGITTYFLNMVLGYRANGVEVTVLTSAHDGVVGGSERGPNGEYVERVFGHRSRYPSTHLGRLIYEVQREIRLAAAAWKVKKDTFLIELPDWQTPLLVGLVVPGAKKYMKLHGPADFIRLINDRPAPPFARIIDCRERYWARRVNLLESGSPVLVRHVEETWGLSRGIPLTPDPIEIEDRENGQETPVDVPQFLKDADSEVVSIVNVGRLEFRKGQHVVCRALNELGSTRSAWKLHFVGPDTSTAPGGTSYREYCQSLIPDDFADRVSWEPPVALAELKTIYSASDVVLISTLDGNYGYTTLQPLASGACVITTLEPGETTSQYAVHGESALLYPSEDAGALADLLKVVIDDSALRDRLRLGARTRSASTLSPAIHAGGVLESIGAPAIPSGPATYGARESGSPTVPHGE